MKKISNIPGSLISLIFIYGGLLLLVFGVGVQFEKLNTMWMILSVVGMVLMGLGVHLKKKEQVRVFKEWLKDKNTSYLKEVSGENYMRDTPELLYIEHEIKQRKKNL